MSSTNSAPIAWPLACQMSEAYETHPARLKVMTSQGEKTLNGLRISATHVQNLLEGKNHQGVTVQPPAKDIYVMFGVKPEDLSKPASQQYFTTMFFAIDAQNNLLKNSIYDYCMPCPDMCPNK